MSCLLLIRHEEPEMRGRFIGRTDPPLTAAGREAAAAKLAGLTVAALYVSPLLRARQTAEAIGGPVEPIVLPELAEIDFGDWEGLTWQEIQQRWPDAACRKIEDWLGAAPPGGELWCDFCARIDRALERVLAGPRPAAIVAHMVVNAALAARLLGRDPKQFRQEYGEILTCDLTHRDPKL
jgi:broad specificity phosphatase PhoE